MNAAAGYATAVAMAIFMVASVLVMTGCDTGNEDDLHYSVGCTDCDDPNPDPNPEKKVESVDHYGCELLSFDWSYKNAASTRGSEYSVELADGGAFCNSAFRYLADIVYTDDSRQKANEEYNNRSSFVGFGYKNTLYVAAGEAATFENAPEITTQNTSNGVVTFLGWEKKTVAVLANTVNDVKSLSIGGKTMTDLCLPEVEFAYTNSTLEKTGEDADYISYNLTIYGDATVDYDGKADTDNFYFVLPIKEAKGGSVTPPVEDDKEIVDYEITNEKLDDNGNYSGDKEIIYSDGSSEIEGTITFSYIYSFEAEGNKTVNVSELSYTKKSATYGKNIRTGENRNFEQLGCTINLIGMKNTVSMVTNRGSRMFSGYWEYPIITMPNGKEIELLHNVAEMTEGSISDNGISGNQLVINMTASGKYGSNSKNLSSTITLVKVDDGGEGGDEDFQTGAYAKDQRVEGSVIKWTLVRTFNKKADTETSMSIAHRYAMSLDSRKATESRIYNAGTPALNETSKMSSSEGNYSFDFCKYTSTWKYFDFSHTANAEGRRNIIYRDGEFDVPVWDTALSIERNGVTLGTSNISSSSDKETYIDNINYVLFAGSSSVSNGSQEVEYSKSIEQKPDEDVVTYNVQKVKVENGKLYYNEIEMHSINTELNKTVEKSIDLVYSLTAIATNDWTAKAGSTGIALTSYAQNYTTAKDYIFGSNRGNNTAKANLQTEYTVTYMGNTYTLSVSGTVNASVNLTSSTSTANTYTFTAKLYADGVEVASDSDTCIETIEEEEKPDEDVVTYNVEKVGVRGNKLYYNEIESHSVNTELNKSVEKSVNLVYSFGVAACNDWTVAAGNPTGLTLNASSFSYTSAKDYTFGSNRGDNVATANLQTSYPVSYMGKTYTLTIAGTVTGMVNKTASTAATSNTYTFTGKLYADGVEVASDSDTCIETIEEEETPDEPENPEKDYIEATSFDCTVSVTDSGLSGIVIIAHYADGTHVASNGATSTTWGNTLVNGQIGTLETVNHTYSWNKGYAAVPMQAFVYNGYDSPYIGCTPKDNSDGTYTVTSNRGGVSYTFPKRAK